MLTIAAALLVLGGFLLVTVNIDRAVSRWSAAAEFSIYLRDDITPEQRVALNRCSTASPLVASPRLRVEGRCGRPVHAGLPGPGGRPGRSRAEPSARLDRGAPEPREGGRRALEALAREVAAAEGVADVAVRPPLARAARPDRLGASAGPAGSWAPCCSLAAVLTVATVVRLSAARAPRRGRDHAADGRAHRSLLRGPLVVEGICRAARARSCRSSRCMAATCWLGAASSPRWARPSMPPPSGSSQPACRRCSSSLEWSWGARAGTWLPARCVDTHASRN